MFQRLSSALLLSSLAVSSFFFAKDIRPGYAWNTVRPRVRTLEVIKQPPLPGAMQDPAPGGDYCDVRDPIGGDPVCPPPGVTPAWD
jgi:hypothetical protein